MKVLLLNLNLTNTHKLRWTGEHLGLAYLASVLRMDDIETDIIDADLHDLDDQTIIRSIQNLNPRLIGISCCDENSKHVVDFISKLKTRMPKIYVCVGGHYPSFKYEFLLNNSDIDFVCIGEGEYSYRELAYNISNNKPFTKIPGILYKSSYDLYNINRQPSLNINDLPFPARDTTKHVLSLGFPAFISSSRGCYGRCNFCSISAFYSKDGYNKWRYRSSESIVNEIKYLIDNFKVNEVIFVDDNFIGTKRVGQDRAISFCDRLINNNINIKFSFNCRANDVEYHLFKKLKSVGLEKVFIGFESFDDMILRYFNKGVDYQTNINAIKILNGLNIKINPSLILFTPWTKLSTLYRAFTILEEDIPDYDISLLFSRLWHLCGTGANNQNSNINLAHSEIIDQTAAEYYRILQKYNDYILHLNYYYGRSRKNNNIETRNLYLEFGYDIKECYRLSLELFSKYSLSKASE